MRGHDDPAVVASALGVAASTLPPEGRRVEQSNSQVDHLRAKCHNAMHVSAKIMASAFTHNLTLMVCEVSKELRERFSEMLTRMKTRWGTETLFMEFASGAWQDEVWLCTSALRDPSALERMRFESWDDGALSSVQDQRLADFTIKFTVKLLRERFCTLSSFTYALPFRLAALLSLEAETVASTLKELKRWWVLLNAVEEKAIANAFFRGLVKGVLWPSLQWARILLVKLAESDFLTVTEAVKTRLRMCFSSLGNSVAAENGFKILRGAEDSNNSGFQSRLQTWFRLSVSNVLPDMDCPPIPTTHQPTKNRRIPAAFFEPEAATCSLDPRSMATLVGPHAYPSPQSCQIAHFGWLACLEFEDRLEDLRTSWLSQLVIPGSMVHGPGWGGLALESTNMGVVIWKLRPRKLGTWTFSDFGKTEGSNWSFRTLVSLDADWQAASYKVVTPLDVMARAKAEGCKEPAKLAMELVGNPQSILEFAAQHGFKHMDSATLNKLFTHLKVPGKRPPDVQSLRTTLVKACLPEMTPEKVAEIFETERDNWGTVNFDDHALLEDTDVDLLQDVLSDDEHAEVKQMIETKKKKQVAKTKSVSTASSSSEPKVDMPLVASVVESTSTTSASASSAPSAPPAPAARPWKPPLGEVRMDRFELEAWSPPGSSWFAETKWHTRWRVKFHRSSGRLSQTSKTFGGIISERDAVRFLLLTLWSWHAEDGGSPSPWIFD